MKATWRTLANRDLAELAEYIAVDSERAAGATVDRIVAVVEMLERFPYLGRVGRASNTREFVVSGTSYRIIYRVEPDRIRILRILHCARRFPKKVE